jgi:hypothetical protein
VLSLCSGFDERRGTTGGVIGLEPVERIEADVCAALRRKPTNEARLAGAFRTLAPLSPELRSLLAKTVETLGKRGSLDRPLYKSAIRALAELGDRRAPPLLKKALSTDGAGGLPTLSAASFLMDPMLAEPLARVAASRHPHLAFAAEVARVARGESDGCHVASVAPKVKEAHRIGLCVEIFVPLLWRPALPGVIAPALAVLRDAERHLGRWLVLAEIATRAGDPAPLREARERAKQGPSSSRAAWSLVGWALQADSAPPPVVRPTVELVARLSDRPSADRDPTFLYRLAACRVASARSMLENLTKGPGLNDEAAIRAALYLLRDHGRTDLREALVAATRSPRREALRGFAAAALFDAGETDLALELVEPLFSSKQLPTVTWGALLRAARGGKLNGQGVVEEPTYRRVQLGWVE